MISLYDNTTLNDCKIRNEIVKSFSLKKNIFVKINFLNRNSKNYLSENP